MKTRLVLSIVAAVIALAVAAPTSFAVAQDTQQVTKVAAKKKVTIHKKRYVARRRGPAYPELEPYRSSGFIGEFPGACAYDRAAGRCMIDLGYGRCVQCDIGGGGRF